MYFTHVFACEKIPVGLQISEGPLNYCNRQMAKLLNAQPKSMLGLGLSLKMIVKNHRPVSVNLAH